MLLRDGMKQACFNLGCGQCQGKLSSYRNAQYPYRAESSMRCEVDKLSVRHRSETGKAAGESKPPTQVFFLFLGMRATGVRMAFDNGGLNSGLQHNQQACHASTKLGIGENSRHSTWTLVFWKIVHTSAFRNMEERIRWVTIATCKFAFNLLVRGKGTPWRRDPNINHLITPKRNMVSFGVRFTHEDPVFWPFDHEILLVPPCHC